MPNKAKVLIFGKLPPPVMGPALATKRILESSLKEEYELLHMDTGLNKEVSEMGRASFSKFKDVLSKYVDLFILLKKTRPSVALIPISQTTMGFLKDAPFILLCRVFKTKSLIQLRGSALKRWLDSASFITVWVFRFCMKRSAGAIVLGENLRYLFEDYFKPQDIHVVPNGGNFSFPTTLPQQKLQLLSIANHLPGKGLLQVLQAIEMLDTSLEFEFHAYGDWDSESYKQNCLKIASTIGPEKVKIHHTIHGEDKLKALAEADIYLFCPIHPEGHPWSIVEAMAAGLPVISSDQGAIIESVKHEETGFIIDPLDTKSLADAIQELIENDERRSAFAERSLHSYQTFFTEEKMISNLKQVIDLQLG